MSFGPKKFEFQDILISSVGALIAGVVGSIIIVIITFFLSNSLDIVGSFKGNSIGIKTTSIFPLIMSIITLLGTSVTLFLTYTLLHLTLGEKYKKNIVVLGQIAFFSMLTYIFITPMYIYLGLQSYDNIMYVFLVHTIIVTFGTNLMLEVLNNYRYILIGLYGSFIGLFISVIMTVLIFSSFSSGYAKLISLVVLLPVINFCTVFFKQVFEYGYFYYYQYTNQDQIGDIFYQIENEEKELLQEEEEKNTL